MANNRRMDKTNEYLAIILRRAVHRNRSAIFTLGKLARQTTRVVQAVVISAAESDRLDIKVND